VLDSKAPEDRAAIESAPHFEQYLCALCAEHFARVRALLDAVGEPYRVNPYIVRGLDYYTRTVFEFVSGALGAQSAVCGGGRYDDLVRSLGGPDTPGVGFGLGLERFLMVVDALGRDEVPARDGIAVIPLGIAARTHLVPLVAELRRTSGAIPVTVDYSDAKIGAHFKRAERANARAAIIVGDDDIANGLLQVRDLELRVQTSLPEGERVDATSAAVLEWYRALPRDGARRPLAV
jgi:histidyl-tRNA synthetase